MFSFFPLLLLHVLASLTCMAMHKPCPSHISVRAPFLLLNHMHQVLPLCPTVCCTYELSSTLMDFSRQWQAQSCASLELPINSRSRTCCHCVTWMNCHVRYVFSPFFFLFSFDGWLFACARVMPVPSPCRVRNSLPTRSSLDVGGKAWVLKAEISRRDDESDEDDDDDGLNHQCCEVLSIPWTLRDVGTLFRCTNDVYGSGSHCLRAG